MATAVYIARVDNMVDGNWFEFEVEIDVWDDDVADYDPSDDMDNVYNTIRDNLNIEWDFDRWEDLPEEDEDA